MTTETSQMSKVYAVIGGFDYEGEDFKSLRLFDCFSAADAYLKQLEDEYDYVLLETREVNVESAIAAWVNETWGLESVPIV